MKSVYEAAHSLDAHMIVHLLEQHGVHAHIQGEYLQGGVGDLPAAGLVRVLVQEDDLSLARKVIEDWERRNPPDPQPAATQIGNTGRYALTFIAGAVVGGIVVWAFYRGVTHTEVSAEEGVSQRRVYANERLVRLEADRNADGSVDRITEFDRTGARIRTQLDNNFDARFEQVWSYRADQLIRFEWDRNHDGKPDYRERYEAGVPMEAQYLHPRTDAVVRRVIYRNGAPHTVMLDSDRDGTFDTQYRLDFYGEPVSPSAPDQ